MAAVRNALVTIDNNAYDQTSSSDAFSKNRSLESDLGNALENSVSDVVVDGKQVDLSLPNTSHHQDYDRSHSFSYPNENVVPKLFLDIVDKLTSKVKDVCPNNSSVLVQTKPDLCDKETMKKYLMKMEQQSEDNMTEKIAPVDSSLDNSHLSIAVSSHHKELKMSISGGLPFDTTSSTIKSCYLCSFCQYLLVEPKCTVCGHRYCAACLEKLIKSEEFPVCFTKNCTQVITKNITYTDSGMKNDIKRLTDIACHNKTRGCSWRGDYTSYMDHFQGCIIEDLQCQDCSTTFTDQFLYEQHGQICLKDVVSCPLKQFGCNIQIRRESIHDHVASSLVQHLLLLADGFSSFINQSTITCQSFSTPVSTLTTANVDNQFLQNKSIDQNQINVHIGSQQSLPSCIQQPIKFERDIVDSGVRLELFQDEVRQFGKQNAIERFPSNDDADFWRINNVPELFKNAKQDCEPTYVSSSFEIDNTGYQISLKLFLNGDEMARNRFLSLYVRIIRDPSHSNLTCSYRYARVLLCLYDKSSNHHHLIHKLILDIDDAYFQEAKMDENKWSKISNFSRLSMVFDKEYGYIHQDTMIIKTHVDFHISQ